MVSFKTLVRLLANSGYRREFLEKKRLQRQPRYQTTTATLSGEQIIVPDAASFLFMYDEIFKKEIYRFEYPANNPLIIDGGANIGLSVIYFKQVFPGSTVIAFEADPSIFDILKKNIETFSLKNVTLINKAIWDTETTLDFHAEGADAGRIGQFDENDKRIIRIPTISLRPYLTQPVALLKLDIEGAETRVLEDISDLLPLVRFLFVEYHSFIGSSQSLHLILKILANAGFRVNLAPPGAYQTIQPFCSTSTYNGMDMQLNIFAINESFVI